MTLQILLHDWRVLLTAFLGGRSWFRICMACVLKFRFLKCIKTLMTGQLAFVGFNYT